MDNGRFYIQLFLFLIAFVLYVPFQIVPKLKNKKTAKIIFVIVVFTLFVSYSTYTAMTDNPIIEARLGLNYIEFKEDERIDYDEIKTIDYYEDVLMKIYPNGYRWGNDSYYSGEANINILNSQGNELKSVYKANVYVNKKVHNYILIDVNNPNKEYVFNLGDEQETENLYQNLMKKCFPENY